MCEGHHFSDCTPSFLFDYLLLSLSSHTPFQVACLMNGSYEDTQYCDGWYSVWRYHEWAVENMNGRKNLLQFNNSWLASLETWYYFRLCFTFTCPGYHITLITKSHTLNCYSSLQKFILITKTYKLVVGYCGSSIYC